MIKDSGRKIEGEGVGSGGRRRRETERGRGAERGGEEEEEAEEHKEKKRCRQRSNQIARFLELRCPPSIWLVWVILASKKILRDRQDHVF